MIYSHLIFCVLMQHIWPYYIVNHDPCKIAPKFCKNIVALVAVTKIKAAVRISLLAVSYPSADISTNISISNNMSNMRYWAIFLSRLSNSDKKADTFVVANSFGKATFVFGFAVMALHILAINWLSSTQVPSFWLLVYLLPLFSFHLLSKPQ